VECAIPGDAGIVDEHIDRAEVGFDFLDTSGAGIERTHVPFINGDAGLVLEFVRRRVVAGIIGGNLVAGGLERLADRCANPPRPPRYQRNSCHVESFPWFSSTALLV
jgi:hypothetical protein